MKKNITIIFLIISLISLANAQMSSSETSGSDFMRIDGHAASASTGETGFLRLSAGNSIFDNPAALSETWSLAMTSTYSRWIMETNYARFGLAIPISRQRVVLGIGGTWLGYGSWDNDNWVDTPGALNQSEMAATDIAGRIGAGWRITHPSKSLQFGIGLDGEYVYRTIGNSAGSGIGVGGGFFFEPHQSFRLAGRVDRLTVQSISFNGGGASNFQEDLPLTLECGIKWNLYKSQETLSGIDILASARRFGEGDIDYGGGIEIGLSDIISFRTGWRNRRNIFAPSLGLGLNIPVAKGDLLFDYAYTPFNQDLFNQTLSGHRITLGYERETVSGFHLLEPIGKLPDRLCLYGCDEIGSFEPIFRWTRAGIPKNKQVEERYRFELSKGYDFKSNNVIVKSILTSDSLSYGRWCEYMPDIELREGQYSWRVYLVDEHDAHVVGAKENIALFTINCKDTCHSCPAKIESIVIENAFFEVDTVIYESWDIPTLPVVFFNENEKVILPPTLHEGVINPQWIKKNVHCDASCSLLLTDYYYQELLELYASRLKRNPDVMLYLSGYTPERKELLSKKDFELIDTRVKLVKSGISENEFGIEERIIIKEKDDYDVCDYRTPRAKTSSERTARGDENRRVEIEARIEGSYIGPFISTAEEIKNSWVQHYAENNASLLRNNPDLVLVAEVLVSPNNMPGHSSKARRHNAINEAMKISNELAESMRVAIPEFSDRIFAWGDTVCSRVCENRIKLFVSADRITYTPKTKIVSLISDENEAELQRNKPEIEIEIKYPCPDSREKTSGWRLDIISSGDNQIVTSWSGDGPPPELITKQWDFRNQNGELIDFRQNYIARMSLTDRRQGDSQLYAETNFKISAKSSKKVDKLLITVFSFDRTDPLSRVMEDRLGVVADRFIHDREYQKQNRSELWITSEYKFEGHTCQLGDRYHNENLSLRRAEAEREKLIQFIIHDSRRLNRLAEAMSIPEENIRDRLERVFDIQGYAWDEPLADPRTPEGRTMNRRTYLSMSYMEERMPPGDKQLFWLNQAESLIVAGEGAAAIASAESVLAYNPIGEIKARAFKAKGDGLIIIGNLGLATDFYSKSLEINNDSYTASVLADTYRKLGKLQQAIEIAKTFANESADAAYVLGEIYLSQSEYSLASDAYMIAVELRPGIADADCKLLACLILSGQKVDKSNRSLEKILRDCKR